MQKTLVYYLNLNILKDIWKVIKSAFSDFKRNDPLRLAASTAFFATFALPAILIVIIQLFGMFINRRIFGRNIMQQLSETLGPNSAMEIRNILKNIYSAGETWYITIAGFVFLLFVSTTLFIIIKNSINQLWYIKVKEHPGFNFYIKQRIRSLGVILLGGLLLVIVFILEGIKVYFEQKFNYLPSISGFVNELIFLIITTIWFSIAFRFIADGRPGWRASLVGSFFTSLLFTFGKIILKYLLLNSNVGEIYGTSGAILLVMLYIFYSSFIFYFGACFIHKMSDSLHEPIVSSFKAYKYRLEEIKDDTPETIPQ